MARGVRRSRTAAIKVTGVKVTAAIVGAAEGDSGSPPLAPLGISGAGIGIIRGIALFGEPSAGTKKITEDVIGVTSSPINSFLIGGTVTTKLCSTEEEVPQVRFKPSSGLRAVTALASKGAAVLGISQLITLAPTEGGTLSRAPVMASTALLVHFIEGIFVASVLGSLQKTLRGAAVFAGTDDEGQGIQRLLSRVFCSSMIDS